MRNMGIMLGAIAPSAINTVQRGMGALRDIREWRREGEMEDAMGRAPRVGQEMPDERAVAERTRLGLPTTADQAAINAARQSRGEEANFTVAPSRTATREDRQAAIGMALENSSDPRNVALASQLRLQGVQLDLAEMERNRRGFADMALRANALIGAGNEEGGRAALETAYNRFFPDGRQAALVRDGDHYVANFTGANGETQRPMRFENLRQAAEFALNFSTPEAYQAMMQRSSAERIARGNNETTIRAAGISAGAHLAGTRLQIAAADRRFAEGAPLRGLQLEEARVRLDGLRDQIGQRRESQQGLTDFTSILQANPMDPRLDGLATSLYTRDPEGFRGTRTVTMPDGSVGREPANTLGVMLQETRGRFTAAVQNVRQQLGRQPASEDVAAARTAFDGQWGSGSFDRVLGSTYSTSSSPAAPPAGGLPVAPRSGQGAPASPGRAPAADEWGRRIPEVPYSAYQPAPPLSTGGGSHAVPGAAAPGFPRPARPFTAGQVDEWLRNNPPPR